jgi:hypothetical protein
MGVDARWMHWQSNDRIAAGSEDDRRRDKGGRGYASEGCGGVVNRKAPKKGCSLSGTP